MAIVDSSVPLAEIHSRYCNENEVDLERWWGANVPRLPFSWKHSNTRKLNLGPIALVMDPSRIEVEELHCEGYRYDDNQFIRTVVCDSFHVNSKLMKTPCTLTRLECEVVYVTLSEFMNYDDALKMAKDWLNAIPTFKANELGFSMPAKMLMDRENDGDWFFNTGCNLCEVSDAADDGEMYDFETIPL